MVEGQELRLPASAEALENRQCRILNSITNLELRLSGAAKLESSDVVLENGDEHCVSKESYIGEVWNDLTFLFGVKVSGNRFIPFSDY